MANNLVKGENLLSGKTLNDNIPLFRDIFEVSRKNKKIEIKIKIKNEIDKKNEKIKRKIKIKIKIKNDV